MTTGDLIAYVLFALSVNSELQTIPTITSMVSKIKVSADKVFDVMYADIGDYDTALHDIGDEDVDLNGQICFNNVTFTYPTRDSPALDGMSFVIEEGSTVGIVGKSGEGKSTIFSLLESIEDEVLY